MREFRLQNPMGRHLSVNAALIRLVSDTFNYRVTQPTAELLERVTENSLRDVITNYDYKLR